MSVSDADAKPTDITGMYGIRRDLSGWKVNIKRREVNYFKRFAFSIYGGEASALLRAQAWRDDIVRMHPPLARAAAANQMRRNNTSGIPGVHRHVGSEGQVTGWTARTYLGPGQIVQKYFRVGRYGAAQAKTLAMAERQKQLAQMQGHRRVHPSEALVREAPPQPLPAGCPPPIVKGEVIRRSNKTGIPGVQHRVSDPRHPGWWLALTYAGDGKNLQKSFSIKTYGNDPAKAMAIAERQRQLAQVRQMRSVQQTPTCSPRFEAH